jgi:hypothetical protein
MLLPLRDASSSASPMRVDKGRDVASVCAQSLPAPLTLTGGGEHPFPPGGERLRRGEDARLPPPPAPSPIEGEGRCLRAMGMTDLSLSAPLTGEVRVGVQAALPCPRPDLDRPLSARRGELGRLG